jgi:hypothetical protein
MFKRGAKGEGEDHYSFAHLERKGGSLEMRLVA